MSTATFIGVDIGTSSVRCTAIDANRNILATSRQDLPAPENPAAGWFEQNPGAWWTATLSSLKLLLQQISPSDIQAISVDGTSSTVMLVDEDNRPVSVGLMYNDSRAAAVLNQLRQFVPEDSITLSASSSLAKAVYLLEQSGPLEATHIVHQADWISSMLSGRFAVSDENNCLKLGYDSVNRQWPEWLRKAPFNLFEKLPEVVSSGSVIGYMAPHIAAGLNLPADIKIVAGTTDSTASTLATGLSRAGEAVTTYGTTLVMKVNANSPVTSAKDGIYSHRLPDGRWLVGGASNSGGNVLLKYFSLEQVEDLSRKINPGEDTGLEYYPLAGTGERFPVNDPKLQPVLEPRPESDVEFLQGIFEGFARIEKLAYDKMAELGAPKPETIYSAGGQATENRALTTIRSRILGIPVKTAPHTQASYGTALIALHATSGI